MIDLGTVLERCVSEGGSDLHLKVGNRPLVRIDGSLRPMTDIPDLSAAETEAILHDLLPQAKLKEFESGHEADFAYSVPGLARFRINAYMQRGAISLAFRQVPYSVATLDALALPDVVRRLAEEQRGVILVTGTTGSGKSTTLAAMLRHINETACKHVVTIEDPIEFLYRDELSAIEQREVGSDTDSFKSALRRVMRQDPDVILIGEMRDEETVRAALSAAETGHLVLSTLHTIDASESINRILDFFPGDQHRQARAMLADTLKGVVSQRLVPRAGGSGRVAICEVVTMTGRVHDVIVDPEHTTDLATVIAEGEYYGMQTFDQALYQAVEAGLVASEDALVYATSAPDFKLLLSRRGHLGTSMEDVPAGA